MILYNPTVSGSLLVTGSLTTTGTITSQTLVVQTITSSIEFNTGSTRNGTLSTNTHQFTGSVLMTGSLSVVTTGTELQVNASGVNIGNALTDNHIISGSVRINPNGLFVSSSGNVGIGTTSPTDGKLVVEGSDNYITSKSTTNIAGFKMINTSGTSLIVQVSNALVFEHLGTERMRITSGGNVGIGSTDPSNYQLGGKFVVAGATSGFYFNDSSNRLVLDGAGTARDLTFYFRNSNSATIASDSSLIFSTGETPTERMRITSAGVLELTSGQLKFPSSQNASADANTLDDYEEGTWTPVVKIGPTTNTGAGRGKYTKIGNVVYIQATISSITKSGTGGLTVEGLPFTVGSSTTFADIQATLRWDDITSSGIIYPHFSPSETRMILQDFSNTGYVNTIQDTQISSTYQLYGISGFYMV
jgi:hypothetical protein